MMTLSLGIPRLHGLLGKRLCPEVASGLLGDGLGMKERLLALNCTHDAPVIS